MNSNKIVKLLLICVLVSSLFVVTISTLAQDATRITALTPASIEEKTETPIVIEGINLDDVKAVILLLPNASPIILPHITQSSERIIVTTPSTLEADQYDLCIQTDARELCRTLEIVQLLQTEIQSVEPNKIYITDFVPSAVITVTLSNFEPRLVATDFNIMLGNQSLIVQNYDRNTGTINAVISDLPSGKYSLNIITLGHTPLTYESITILGNLNVLIDTVESTLSLQGANEIIVTIKGQNLALVNSITGIGTEDCYSTSSSGCELVSVSNSEIILKLTHKSTQEIFTQDWQLGFPDGSIVSVTPITLKPRIAPNNFITWFTYIGIILYAGFVMFTMFVNDMFSKHNKNKTAPSFSESTGAIIAGLFIMALPMFVTAIISFFGSIFGYALGWQFQVTTILTYYNVIFFFSIAYFAGRFYPIGSGLYRYIIAIIFSSVAVVLPFLLQSRMQTEKTILWEIGLFVIGFVSGQLILWYANNKLEQSKVYGPTDDVLKVRIRQRLYQVGEVVAERDFADIAQNRIINLLAQYVADHENKQDIYFSERSGHLRFTQHETISNLSSRFGAVEALLEQKKDVSDSDLSDAIFELYTQIQQALEFANGTPYSLTQLPAHFFLYSAISPELESVLPTPFPVIIFATNKSIKKAQLKELKTLLNMMKLPLRFAIVIIISETVSTRGKIRNEIVENVTGQNIVVFGKEDCQEISISRLKVRRALMNAIQEQVDLKILSPYRTEAPTPKDMFYGRRAEIKRILETVEDGSVIVLGARRIGKTSVLQIVQQELVERQKVFLYLDCYPINNYELFFTNLAIAWSFVDIDFAQYKRPADFRQLVKDLQQVHPGRQIVFQFDEVDQLLVYDNSKRKNKKTGKTGTTVDEQKEPLFRMMRTLSQEKKCQFVFSGERQIMRFLHNPQSALFNFPKPIRLGVLGKQTTYDLIRKPMELVGIQLQADEVKKILDTIHQYTAGHPNLIQVLCDNILRSLSDQNTRILTQKIVMAECTHPTYGDRYRKTFWSQATPSEKAISATVSELGDLTSLEIHQHLTQYGFELGIQELDEGISYLELSQLLTMVGNRYRLLSKQFATFMDIYPYSFWYKQWLNDYEDDLFSQG